MKTEAEILCELGLNRILPFDVMLDVQKAMNMYHSRMRNIDIEEEIKKVDDDCLKPFLTAQFGDRWKDHARKNYTPDIVLDIAFKNGRKVVLLERLLRKIQPPIS